VEVASDIGFLDMSDFIFWSFVGGQNNIENCKYILQLLQLGHFLVNFVCGEW